MTNLNLTTNPAVTTTFDNYPDSIREKMYYLRELVLEAAEAAEDITALEETLKWGEPSYLAKKGSTLRMDWKAKKPDQYAMYFKCTSKLVMTFKKVFGDLFTYEGKRAIVFTLEADVPVKELKQCITTTLRYHRVKHLPDLGMQ
ncbi:MAG: DUF1801 domain-containing protein [Saprospiraceae bacterium]